MNPLLMMLAMQPHAGRRPSPTALVATGLVNALAWSLVLLFSFGIRGLLVGWPVTLVACAAIGASMERYKLSPGDVAGIMLHLVMVVAVGLGGVLLFL